MGRWLTLEQKKQIVETYEKKDMPLDLVAEKCSVHISTVKRVMDDYETNGSKIKKPVKLKHFTVAFKQKVMDELIANKGTAEELSMKHGVHHRTIQKWFKKVQNGDPLDNRKSNRIPKMKVSLPERTPRQTQDNLDAMRDFGLIGGSANQFLFGEK